MKSNLILVGLDYAYNKKISNLISNKLDMFLLDVDDFMEYTLLSREKMLEKCGLEYLCKKENDVIKACSDYENTIINIPFVYFGRNGVSDLFKKNSYIVYINRDKGELEKVSKQKEYKSKLTLDLITYEDKNNYLLKCCDISFNTLSLTEQTIANNILTWFKEQK